MNSFYQSTLILLLGLSSLSTSIIAQCTHPDFNALMKFYQSTHGENWKTNTGWKEGAAGANCDPCKWAFVKCNSANRVTELNFKSGMGMNGAIPPEIGELTELTFLNINREPNLQGTLPDELAKLKKMKVLKIRSTGISGPIPPDIFQPKLEQLFLSRNMLSGTIPTQITNATRLYLLFLNYNQLSGPIPNQLYSMTKLTDLFVNDNQLTGSISPKIGQLRRLKRMSFGSNQFTGTIPVEIGNLSSLTALKFDENQLTGGIPKSISKLKVLDEIKLNDNQLSGPIIGELASLSILTQVQMQDNQFECFDEELKKLCAKNQLKRSSFENNKNPLSWQDFCNNDDYPYICNVATLDLSDNVKIYPNPVSNSLVIEGIGDQMIKHLSMVNQLGVPVLDWYYLQDNSIDVSRLSPGLYTLSLHVNNNVIIKKVLVQK